MKNDIDQLMKENGIDALLIVGPAQHNPAMFYLTGGGHITNADLIKKVGETPVIFHGSMEREEAAKTGLITCSYDQFSFSDYLKKTNNNQIDAHALRYRDLFSKAGVEKGKIALYGSAEIGAKFAILQRFQQVFPEFEITGLIPDSILLKAMMIKDPNEINRIRKMGVITTNVVGKVADFLSHQRVENETLIGEDNSPVTIGLVKSKINYWLAEAGAENPDQTIFAIGRDAGVPHSQGNDSDIIQLGKTIVFDIFPCENGGGYFYDFTRTWCIGYAPEDVQKLYDQVKSVYDSVVSELTENTPFKHYQRRTCELFEEMGHPTVLSNPSTLEGYVHSLGHGLGLHVHEMPFSGLTASEQETLASGSVFTIEPGLYYPDRGMGVRLEDTYYVSESGTIEKIVDFPMDLIIPIKS
ncbi:MAG: Xaa-Pro peptidase family protein [Anaerolineaceae bacterium]|nr:Xaa-Pro peptidase family protein [Anaerolineaceae bacterium]